MLIEEVGPALFILKTTSETPRKTPLHLSEGSDRLPHIMPVQTSRSYLAAQISLSFALLHP